MSAPPIVGVPALDLVRLGAVAADDLADLLPLQLADEPGREQEREEHRRDRRRDGAERDVAEDVEPAEPVGGVAQREEELVDHLAALSGGRRRGPDAGTRRDGPGHVDLAAACAHEGIDDPLGAHAARGLHEDHVAGLHLRDGDARGVVRVAPRGPRRTPAPLARPAIARSARPPQLTASRAPASAIASPSGRVLVRRRGPELAHLAEHDDGAAGPARSRASVRRAARTLSGFALYVSSRTSVPSPSLADLHAPGPCAAPEARVAERRGEDVVRDRADDGLGGREGGGEIDGRGLAEERQPRHGPP